MKQLTGSPRFHPVGIGEMVTLIGKLSDIIMKTCTNDDAAEIERAFQQFMKEHQHFVDEWRRKQKELEEKR